MPRNQSRTEAAVRRSLDSSIDASATPGLQYLAVDARDTLFELTGGWADIARRIPIEPRTTLMAYSMSKTITAAATLQLIGLGKLGLDESIRRHLPEVPYAADITVRQLLSHTSGIPNPIPLRWVHPAAQHARFEEGRSLAAVLAASPRLRSAPGTRYAYSNIGYWLLGRIVEYASGEAFTGFVARHVLGPLGIAPDEVGYAIAASVPHANGYLEKYSLMNLLKGFLISGELIGDYEGKWLRIEPHYLNGPAFGGLVGTARGFGRFLQDQLRPRSVLFDDSRRHLFFEQQQAGGKPVPMTLGWHIGDLGGTRFYFKEGGGGGFHCEMRIYPEAEVGTVLLTNATAFDVKRTLNVVDREVGARVQR